jgi:DNA-directed RNA polymerase subunit RPC12/RpoP
MLCVGCESPEDCVGDCDVDDISDERLSLRCLACWTERGRLSVGGFIDGSIALMKVKEEEKRMEDRPTTLYDIVYMGLRCQSSVDLIKGRTYFSCTACTMDVSLLRSQVY